MCPRQIFVRSKRPSTTVDKEHAARHGAIYSTSGPEYNSKGAASTPSTPVGPSQLKFLAVQNLLFGVLNTTVVPGAHDCVHILEHLARGAASVGISNWNAYGFGTGVHVLFCDFSLQCFGSIKTVLESVVAGTPSWRYRTWVAQLPVAVVSVSAWAGMRSLSARRLEPQGTPTTNPRSQAPTTGSRKTMACTFGKLQYVIAQPAPPQSHNIWTPSQSGFWALFVCKLPPWTAPENWRSSN